MTIWVDFENDTPNMLEIWLVTKFGSVLIGLASCE